MIRLLLETEIEAFLIDRKARGLSAASIRYYEQQLTYWHTWALENGIHELPHVTPRNLRQWLVHLSEDHNPGGVHASYRALRAFLRWAWAENRIDAPCPISRVRSPKVPRQTLEPVSIEHLAAMLKTCKRRQFLGDRDRAVLSGLLDTGCRATEFVSLDIGDVDRASGSVLIREGKGGKPRTTFMGDKSMRELIRYLKHRPDATEDDPLWITQYGQRLRYDGLRAILRIRAKRANVPQPSIHSFRRGFALYSLRDGMDIYSLQRLMGHESLDVLRRYLAQTESDLRAAHHRAGLLDDLL